MRWPASGCSSWPARASAGCCSSRWSPSPRWSGASARRGRSWRPCSWRWRSRWRSSTSGRSGSTSRARSSRCPPPGVVVGGVGLAFALAYGQVDGRNAGQRGRVRVRPAGPRRAGRLAGLAHARRRRGPPRLARLALAARPALGRALVAARGEMGGFAWAWIGACLLVIPLTVYALSYIPYLQLGHAFAGADAGPGYGWSLDELHAQMFGYHFSLTAGHASASPWWSWPLALKPTWFFNGTLRRPPDRGDLQRRQPDPVLGRRAGRRRLRRPGLAAAVAGARAASWRPSPSSSCRGSGSSAPPSRTTT